MATPTRQEIIEKSQQWISWYTGNCRAPKRQRVTKGERLCLDPDVKPSKGWWVTFEIFVDREEFER